MGSVGEHGCAGGGEQVGPAGSVGGSGAAVDVVEVETGLDEVVGEAGVGSGLSERAELVDLRWPLAGDGVADAAQDDVGRDGVELHVAAGGQERELCLDGFGELAVGAAEQSPVAAVEAEPPTVGANEVEHGAGALGTGLA